MLVKLHRKRDAERVQSRFGDAILIAPLSLLLLYPLLDSGAENDPGLAQFFLSAILLILGITIRIKSLVDLGDNFSFRIGLKSDHRIVTNGMYRIIRHPLYFSLILMMLGAMMFRVSTVSIVAFITASIGIGVRISREERFLREKLPGYREYCKTTKFILPFIF